MILGMGLQSLIDNVLPFAVMVLVECGDVGMIIVGKAAMTSGMSSFIFVVYFNTLGTLILLPFIVVHICRGNQLPLSFSLLCRFFILGFVGICVGQICGFVGINYSSPTLGAAMGNLIPAFTFLLAIALRMEKPNLRRSGMAKILGTAIAISGAFVIIFYKGQAIKMVVSPSGFGQQLFHSQHSNWALGGGFLAITCICISIWNVLQATAVKEYPDETTIVFFFCCFGTIQCAVVALVMERTPGSWVLQPGIGMIAIGIAAINNVARSGIITWCLRKKGPVFVSMFKPVSTAIAMISGIIFLGDNLYVGSIIGAATISVGFYAVIWAQTQEQKKAVVDFACGPESSMETTPLLQNLIVN